MIAASRSCFFERAIRCRITSVSLEVRKIDPSRSSASRIGPALTRLPLWATPISPLKESIRKGCAFNSSLVNAQPFLIDSFKGEIGVAHNGNLVNAGAMREALEREGSILRTERKSVV